MTRTRLSRRRSGDRALIAKLPAVRRSGVRALEALEGALGLLRTLKAKQSLDAQRFALLPEQAVRMRSGMPRGELERAARGRRDVTACLLQQADPLGIRRAVDLGGTWLTVCTAEGGEIGLARDASKSALTCAGEG